MFGGDCKVLKKDDKGPLVKELNIRLSGFGGNVPTDVFTDRTVEMVKQFQQDYMEITPTGVVCGKMFKAIDEFNEKYTFDFDRLKCPCGVCDGFGRGLSSSQKQKANIKEKNRSYEYPGIHRTLIWTLKSTMFYLEKKSALNLKLGYISSGYRCQQNNIQKGRTTTNHMGKAVDVHFYKNNDTLTTEVNCDLVRDEILISKSGANLRWPKENVLSLEPSTKDRIGSEWIATNWVHFDVRRFNLQYLKDEFFVKSLDEAIGEKITEIATNEGYDVDCNCEGEGSESNTINTDRVSVNELSFSENGVEFLKGYESERKENGKHVLYDDDAGYCTIGYGHLVAGKKSRANIPNISTEFQNGLTDNQAKQLLKSDIKSFETAVKNKVTVKLYQHEFDALVSFSFNVGATNFKTSTLLKYLNQGKFEDVPNEFLRWNKAGGEVMSGLTKRRKAESNIFKNNIYDSTH